MRLSNSIFVAVVVLSVVGPTMARQRQTTQFKAFFPAWNNYLLDIIDNDCPEQRDMYNDPSNNPKAFGPGYHLALCILNEIDEFRKIEMGVTTLLLGLLPTMLQQGGPTVAEVSVLATRRPLLASLLSIAMPSVSMGGPMANPAEALRLPVDFQVRAGFLAVATWPWILISMAEYIIAAAGVANIFYLVYQLAYRSVSVSSIAMYSGILPQTYPIFMWLSLLVPVHTFGYMSLKLSYRASEEVGNIETPKVKALSWKSWLRFIGGEFIPCAQGDPLLLTKEDKTVLSIVVHYLTSLATGVVFVFGSVALSSCIFISLADVVPVIARAMLGSIVCRLVLTFELHGMREVTSASELDYRTISS
jgi:hypothetical protein